MMTARTVSHYEPDIEKCDIIAFNLIMLKEKAGPRVMRTGLQA